MFIHSLLLSFIVLLNSLIVTIPKDEQAVLLKKEEPYCAYLMAYFTNSSVPQTHERLTYAVSTDGRNWTPLTNAPLPNWEKRFVRDPYLRQVNGVYHMVHTTGFNGCTIAHWTSTDLINWKGGPVQVMPKSKIARCWAPEFVWCEEEQVFYVHWSSKVPSNPSRMTLYYVKTKDWKDINPNDAKVYYDHGKHCIDLTIEKYNGAYYGFHQVGMWRSPDDEGNLMMTSKSLNPDVQCFATMGKPGKSVFPNEQRPTEAVAGLKLIEGKKWYFYADPNRHKKMNLQAWETEDFKTFKEIEINVPKGAKHCSFIQITQTELKKLRAMTSSTSTQK